MVELGEINGVKFCRDDRRVKSNFVVAFSMERVLVGW